MIRVTIGSPATLLNSGTSVRTEILTEGLYVTRSSDFEAVFASALMCLVIITATVAV